MVKDVQMSFFLFISSFYLIKNFCSKSVHGIINDCYSNYYAKELLLVFYHYGNFLPLLCFSRSHVSVPLVSLASVAWTNCLLCTTKPTIIARLGF